MNSSFYLKMAASNLKKNGRLFAPYILMNIGIITMFYIMHAISVNEGLSQMPGAQALSFLLTFGTYVIGIFSAIFIFYTNSFLIKRRKKEIGLYNILGMGKRHIAIMLMLETILIALLCIGLGLISGIALSKLMFLILLKILGFTVALHFSVSLSSVSLTFTFFAIVLLVTLVYNLGHIHLSNPIQLLKGSNVGEREPKVKWIMALLGFITLGIGYFIANTVEAPLQALFTFFIAVVLVMVGTYFIFIAGSIAILKLLKKNKQFYYTITHFTSVSGMIYRMKQNAVGLANICILSTAVLVTLSTTVSLYIGMEDMIDNRFTSDVTISSYLQNSDIQQKVQKLANNAAVDNNVELIDFYQYQTLTSTFVKDGMALKTLDYYNVDSNTVYVLYVTSKDYNQIYNANLSLNDNEVVLVSNNDKFNYPQLLIDSVKFEVVDELDQFADFKKTNDPLNNEMLIIFSNEQVRNQVYSNSSKNDDVEPLSYTSFNINGASSDEIKFNDSLQREINSISQTYMFSKQNTRTDFVSVYGGFFFLGIFLGSLFLMATVMIIYYKQVSEGYDDKLRFEIMQKVGMSVDEIKRTINTQIVMVFFLPLLFAMIHITFAFKVITQLLALFGFSNVPLFILCTFATLLVFAFIYLIVYLLTARTYYKIVK
ncbi:MAG: hypothetical protein BGO41_04065 [Clostridiales bacterium 38-18]|nr:MAG: hypothetical protein BGO41_04065 [Clostridiales bacterium 38-18]